MRSVRIPRDAPPLDIRKPSDLRYERRTQSWHKQVCRERVDCAEPPSRPVLGQSKAKRDESVSGAPFQSVVSNLRQTHWHEAVLTSEANEAACNHLLQHYRQGRQQEDLCFALWTPSTGTERETSIVTDILLPFSGERRLHGNTSFEPEYLARLKFLGLISHKWLNANHNIGLRSYRYWTRLRSGRLA